MPPTKELFKFVQERYNVKLREDLFWHKLDERLHIQGYDEHNVISFLTYAYPGIARSDLNVAHLTDDLFTALIVKRAALAEINYQMLSSLCALFGSWTQSGSRDVPVSSINLFSPSLLKVFRDNDLAKDYIVDMVYQSPNLWTCFESDIISIMCDAENTMRTSSVFQKATHRHAPERIDLYNTDAVSSMYMDLCGSNIMMRTPLEKMRSVLVGPHNNALAWHIALQMCVENDETLPGKWMQMLDTFSALKLETKDQDAWRFWHSLCERTKGDDSGRALVQELSKMHIQIFGLFLKPSKRVLHVVSAQPK